MNWLIIIFCIVLYIHIYLHFKINPYNELSTLNDICKQDITNTIYYKLPFIFDGSTILNKVDLSACTYLKDKNTYIKTYNSTPILEPYVKFFTKNEIYKLKKGKILDIHRNLECRNFYMVHKGKISITCIHPKYAEHFKKITPDTHLFLKKMKI